MVSEEEKKAKEEKPEEAQKIDNPLGILLYENCDKKRKEFKADEAKVKLSIDLCKPGSSN